jgi:serine phosphatase RsbU (regulator of sigma subunit)
VQPDLPLGLGDPPAAPPTEVELSGPWALLFFTDGIYEGKRPDGGRVDLDDFVGLVADELAREGGGAGARPGAGPERVLDRVIARSRELCGGALADDVALLWLGSEPAR